jgi:hypothetical protein
MIAQRYGDLVEIWWKAYAVPGFDSTASYPSVLECMPIFDSARHM